MRKLLNIFCYFVALASFAWIAWLTCFGIWQAIRFAACHSVIFAMAFLVLIAANQEGRKGE